MIMIQRSVVVAAAILLVFNRVLRLTRPVFCWHQSSTNQVMVARDQCYFRNTLI